MEIETQKAFETFLSIFEFGLQKMTGSERRLYLAQIAKQLGYGGMKLVCDHFAIDYKTLQKGMEELDSGDYILMLLINEVEKVLKYICQIFWMI